VSTDTYSCNNVVCTENIVHKYLNLNFVAYPNVVQQFDGSVEFICVCVRACLLACTGVPLCMWVCVSVRVYIFLN